jgi:hypothetical protein
LGEGVKAMRLWLDLMTKWLKKAHYILLGFLLLDFIMPFIRPSIRPMSMTDRVVFALATTVGAYIALAIGFAYTALLEWMKQKSRR